MQPNYITKPNQERFDMSLEETTAFWLIICAEYAHRYVRENSLKLFNNGSVLRESDDY